MRPVNIGVDTPLGASEFRGTARFELERMLGAGRLGVVYQARDRVENHQIALKTLRHLDRQEVYRFRKEFRSLSALSHKNLVRLGELYCDEGHWFFTMELVEGRDFLSYVRPDARAWDEARLRGALSQLAVALSALHAALKVHKAVKPTNVRVSTSDRLVLLDFGLAGGEGQGPMALDVRLDDSATYLAPEQIALAPSGPAADWYGVGVVLYQALAGCSPYPGAPLEALMQKQRDDPVPPSRWAPNVPSDLDQLCMDLLRRDPRARPSGRDVLLRLGIKDAFDLGSPVSLLTSLPADSFVGRHTELVQLGRAWRDSRERAVTLLLCGESGLGKSALVRRLADVEASKGVLTLSGRCHEREAQPYHAFSGIMDALSERLSRLDPVDVALLLPKETSALARLFPSLLRVLAVARLGPPRQPDPQELRSRAFLALRELFATLAEPSGMFLCIDDLQWADADSLALLVNLLEPPDPPRLLFLATVQTGLGGHDQALSALLPGDLRRLDLGPLRDEDARLLVEGILAGSSDGTEVASRVALEAAGHPLYLQELAHHVALVGARGPGLRLDEVLWARIQALEPEARRVLEILAVSGTPLGERVLGHATLLAPEPLAGHLAVLRAGRLLRGQGTSRANGLDVYHSRIRHAVLSHLEDDSLRRHHGCLAEALEASEGQGEQGLALVHHYEAAGQMERAAAQAERAAVRASAALAFDKAAELYLTALRLGKYRDAEQRALTRSMADALANAGRGRKAAEAYQAAVAGAHATEALELERRAAEQYFRSACLDEGFAVIQRVLASVGMRLPRTRRDALLSVALRRAQLRLRGLRFRPRQEDQIDQETLTRVDLCWTASLGLAVTDFLSGADFQTRQLLLALDAGEPLRIVRSLAGEAAFSASSGGRGWRRTDKLVKQAEEMARELQHPYALGMASLVAGIACLLSGRWRLAFEHSERAEGTLSEGCAGVAWEMTLARSHMNGALGFLGELKELARRVPEGLRDAQARGDQFGVGHLSIGDGTLAWLARDDADVAQRHVVSAKRDSSRKSLLVHLFLVPFSEVAIYRYLGEDRRAWACAGDGLGHVQRSLLWKVQLLRCRVWNQTALAALGVARGLPEGSERRLRLGDAERAARHLRAESMPYAKALSLLIRAGVTLGRGDVARAPDHYALAARMLDSADMALHAACARLRQGELIGGDHGRALTLAAEHFLQGQSIKNPSRLADQFAPLMRTDS